MFLFQSTFYALQIVFILSISDFALGRPYFPGIGISVTHPTQIKSQFGQRNWNDYDNDVSNKFGSPDDVDDGIIPIQARPIHVDPFHVHRFMSERFMSGPIHV